MLYILSNKSVAVAKEFNIHINTFYQRLKSIEEKLEISVDNQEDVLKINLACHLKDFLISSISTRPGHLFGLKL